MSHRYLHNLSFLSLRSSNGLSSLVYNPLLTSDSLPFCFDSERVILSGLETASGSLLLSCRLIYSLLSCTYCSQVQIFVDMLDFASRRDDPARDCKFAELFLVVQIDGDRYKRTKSPSMTSFLVTSSLAMIQSELFRLILPLNPKSTGGSMG